MANLDQYQLPPGQDPTTYDPDIDEVSVHISDYHTDTAIIRRCNDSLDSNYIEKMEALDYLEDNGIFVRFDFKEQLEAIYRQDALYKRVLDIEGSESQEIVMREKAMVVLQLDILFDEVMTLLSKREF